MAKARRKKASEAPARGRAREFRWIDWLRRAARRNHPSLVVGIGDDAAVWRPPPGSQVVLTTDTMVQDVHFRWSWFRPGEVGSKAVAASLSDLAAMGARAGAVLLSLEVPADLEFARFKAIFSGAERTAASFNAVIIGGNLSGASGGLSLTATCLGTIPHGSRPILRAGARPGDEIWVTGDPAAAGLGMAALARWGRAHVPSSFRDPVRRFLRPTPRLSEGSSLLRWSRISALIDVSDGLLADLGHILEENSVGAELELPADLLSTSHRRRCRELDLDPVDVLLNSGEAYELLFTTPPGGFRPGRRRRPVSFNRIGRIRHKIGVVLSRGPGESVRVFSHGWDHLSPGS